MTTVAISLLGTSLDQRGQGRKRWDRWRPTVSLCQQEDLVIDRLELLFQHRYQDLADQVSRDIALVSPETRIKHHKIEFDDPWDFETVYAALHDFARSFSNDAESEDLLVHITTGTHVAQICLYLLTEAHYLPGKLVQTSPPGRDRGVAGHYQIIDLDLSKYDRIASRFEKEHREGTAYLKGGIETRNARFNTLIEQLERVSIRSEHPILLTGPTGAGKSQLARRVYELKKQRGQVEGPLVEINCATLRGDNAMSTLFGHVKGAFTGAVQGRAGLLAEADGGILFLDEIGEMGNDEQAMLLRAIEEKRFMPVGSDQERTSRFQLIAGTNRDLFLAVDKGDFREDLLARINLWSYQLLSLKERLEDLEPNLNFELERFARESRSMVSFNKAGRERFLAFASSPEALWKANFRDLNASVTRMATLAPGGRITEQIVAEEIARLRANWRQPGQEHNPAEYIASFIGVENMRDIDLFDQLQLRNVVEICRTSNSVADAGRKLFNVSRARKSSTNDSHRLRQYLAKFGLRFEECKRSDNSA